MFGRRPTFGASESALASARAEVAAAQARTRDIEKERARLEAELGRHRLEADLRRAGNVSAVVSLIRHLGIGEDVLKVLGPLHGWHEAGTDNCEEYT